MAETKGSDTNSSSESESTFSAERHCDPVAKLPTGMLHMFSSLVLYKNYWVLPYYAQTTIILKESFKARHDDTILASNPKCGTTWLKALTFAITNRSRYNFSDHPLLTQHPQEIVPFIDVPQNGDVTYVDSLNSPRLLATHMPLSFLPDSIKVQGCRIIYICREPKDAFVSWWHFAKRGGANEIDFDEAFNKFCEGRWPLGPFWNHCLEYWTESIARPNRVLFLKYEEMISDPVKFIKSIADFLGVPFTIQEEDSGIPEEVAKLCSFKFLSTLRVNQIGVLDNKRSHMVFEKSAFFRRGKVGDWANHMSKEMESRLDNIMQEKLKGSGLVL